MTTNECLIIIYCVIAERETLVMATCGDKLREAKLDELSEIKKCVLALMAEPQTNEDVFRNLPLGELIDYLAVRGCPPPYSDDCREPRTLCTHCWGNWFREKGGETNDSQRI